MPRARDLGVVIGSLPTGPTNSVLDVAGVGLGHATVVRDEPPPPVGRGIARTGVTCLVLADDAFTRMVPAGGAVLNGAGECTGFITAAEWGSAETPVYLTSTLQLGRVYDSACRIELAVNPACATDFIIPVVGECDDSYLNDARHMQVEHEDVVAAYDAAMRSRGATTPPDEGAVGSGTGMSCLGFKGGIGTSSRVVGEHTVAVLLMTNFGSREELIVNGVPVGRALGVVSTGSTDDPGSTDEPKPAGSCIGIVVTDAPVDGASCARLARRVGLGLARAGSVAHHGSGEIFMAFGTGMRLDRDGKPDGTPVTTGRALDPLFAAVVEAAEEAVLNSMFTAPTVVGRDGNTSEGAHNDEVLRLMSAVVSTRLDRRLDRRGRRMREQEVRIPVRDGSWLAATLYLPDGPDPQPCLVEALPYRKDDLTSSYASSYRRLCSDHGYAVCRIDVRGTGSSPGDALDEYQEAEQSDLPDAFAWLAAQEWCDGQIGMWGTSYSGFNSLQIACEQPPELKAICAIYATDDRWTDDVHWRGGALRLVDLVDYDHYMTPMCVLPPVPGVWGEDWYDEWLRRLETNEPWVLTWLRENRHGPYWDHGSVRLGGTTAGYERVRVPTMIVAGWADGYRNNSFRTVAELARHGTPHRLLAGPWAHADPSTAMPGPRIDFDAELAAWFDRWLRGVGDHQDRCDVFVRSSTRPEIDLDLHEGRWLTLPSVPPVTEATLDLTAPVTLRVIPDVGTAAWIDCAGHLPWGQSGDQRLDDERSLTWEIEPPPSPVVGHPVFRARLWATEPQASISVKLCDVFPDGTSALVSRGSLDLSYRNGVHGSPSPLVPGHEVQVEVVLDACAYEWTPGNTLRVSVAGADWPNTIAPPAPLEMTLRTASLTLPLLDGEFPSPTFGPGAAHSSESAEGVGWAIHHDVLTRVTSATTRSESRYLTPYDGTAHELYVGEVAVDTRTFAQVARANTVFDLTWPGIEATVRSSMTLTVTPTSYDVGIWAHAVLNGEEIHTRTWTESIPR